MLFIPILSSIMNRMMEISKLKRFEKLRQLHTSIVSQETIKPSIPTPPHLKTYNLSTHDQFTPNMPMSLVFFYKTNGDINTLKNSLSQSLSDYYPLAGRFLTHSPSHIDCNDEGVVFLEACHDKRLDHFVSKKEQEETINQLLPNSLRKGNPSMAEVQLNRFTCGGAAVGISISHKIADGFTMANFIQHWSTISRCGFPVSPSMRFISSTISKPKIPELVYDEKSDGKYVTRSFEFPNSKLHELKNKVNAMGATPVNPTRVESLTSLLFKSAVNAATTKSGSLQPSNLSQPVNLRNTKSPLFPMSKAGNMALLLTTKIDYPSQIETITKFRKLMPEIQDIKDEEELSERLRKSMFTFSDNRIPSYLISSVCRFPFYEVDFGFGKPVQVMHKSGNVKANILVLMDTPSGDGIEVTAQLKEEEMAVFENDEELLAYAKDV